MLTAKYQVQESNRGIRQNNTEWSPFDDAGYIVTDKAVVTSASGILAEGDICRHSPHRIATAVGNGVTAAMSIFRYLQEARNGAGITNP